MATSSVKIRVSGEDTCRRPLMLPADMTNDRWSFACKGLQVWRRDPSEADTGVSLRRRVTKLKRAVARRRARPYDLRSMTSRSQRFGQNPLR